MHHFGESGGNYTTFHENDVISPNFQLRGVEIVLWRSGAPTPAKHMLFLWFLGVLGRKSAFGGGFTPKKPFRARFW